MASLQEGLRRAFGARTQGYTRTIGTPRLDSTLKRLQDQQNQAKAANEARLSESKALYDDIINQFKPGGTYGAGVEENIERLGTKSVAAGEQNLVSRGLYGTTQRAGLRKKFEEDVAAPSRLSLEKMRQDKLAQARLAKAGAVERVEDTGPNQAMVASLSKTASSAPTRTVRRHTGPAWLTNALNKSYFNR